MTKKVIGGEASPQKSLDQKSAVEAIKAAAAARQAQQQVPQQQIQAQGQAFDFTKCHLHIGMPCYGGNVSEPTMTSLLRFILMAQQVGLNWSLDTMVNESLVTRARNNLMAKMMTNTTATHFMFIDADIRFQPESILQMMACDKDVIGGLYPKKALPVNYVINLKPQTKVQGDIFTVDTMGTGFLMFKRHVYEQLCKAHPETKYVDDVGLGKQYEPTMYAIFDCEIDQKGHYLSEDWLFCRRWSAIGGEIWAHGKVLLNHIGHYEFVGDLSKMPSFTHPTGEAADIGAGPAALQDAIKMAQKAPA
ncbi:hypothetical protein UFOVP257_345 [uncultured Caudovirales phage]|uniref:Nucleotide-diphospho-sugar transferase domain-containing protein n=1 Tax=uncultured Caudovirales phage TaxID=2100421 RepID=A0A6J5LJV6_9CAUD|nr:hypothetical protein UFOVP257_345 [uncultured Caudovirales phage]